MPRVYRVFAAWDADGGVWVAESNDVPGLVTGAPSIPELIEKLRVLVPELLEENGCFPEDDGPPEVPFEVIATHQETVRRRA